MAPWVKGDDLGRIGPCRLERDRDGWFGLAVVRLVSRREGSHGDGENSVDGIWSGMGTECVTVLDG
jgi:hypothetical protein